MVLDGDTVRARLHPHLGFSEAEIKKNNALVVELCQAERGHFDVIIVAMISPFSASRDSARSKIAAGFYEVYLNADLSTLVERDVKGIYRKAKNGELRNVIGYSPEAPYEEPASPDLVLHTTKETPDISIGRLHEFVVAKLRWKPGACATP
jgi:adenylylsulfate kinase